MPGMASQCMALATGGAARAREGFGGIEQRTAGTRAGETLNVPLTIRAHAH